MAKRIAPRYDMLFGEGKFNATLLIGPDPLGANFDFKVFLEARRRLISIGFRLTDSKRGFVEYQKTFNYDNKNIKARIRLFLGRNFSGNLQETWRESLAKEDLIYLKTHAGYGKHLSLSDDVIYFTDAMKEGFDLPERKPYQCTILIAARVKCIIRMYSGTMSGAMALTLYYINGFAIT